jgi:large subunit ribosomal protein L21
LRKNNARKYFPARLDGRSIFQMYAIIENGSKQYRVAVDDIVKFEKLNAKVGDKVSFNVLLVSDENGIKTAAEAAKYVVEGEVLAQDKEKKIIVYKYKAKKNERKKQGHRQPYTKVKITAVSDKA